MSRQKGTKKERGASEKGTSAALASDGEAILAPVAGGPAEVVAFEVRKVREHPANTRRRDEDDIGRLAAAIAAQGQLQPALIREDGLMISGHRRLWALQSLGRSSIDAVLISCSDEEARALLLGANAHVPPDPLAEADVVRRMMDGPPPRSLAQVAAALGWDRSRVQRRRQLSNLSAAARAELQRPDGAFARWPVAWLERFAVLDHATQDTELDSGYGLDFRSETELREWVDRQARQLSTAPFDPLDGLLVPDAGPCYEAGDGARCCPRSSIARPGLFDTQVDGDRSTARCLDAECWLRKRDAHVQRRVGAERAKHDGLVVLADANASATQVRQMLGGQPVREWWGWQAAKKTTPGAVPVARVAADGRVTTGYALPTSPSAAAPTKKKAADKTAAERLRDSREQVHRRRQAAFVDGIGTAIEEMYQEGPGRAAVPPRPTLDALLMLVGVSGPLGPHGRYPLPVDDVRRGRELVRLDATGWERAIWRRLQDPLAALTKRSGNPSDLDREVELAEWLMAEVLGRPDTVGEVRRDAEAAVPAPKWWPAGTVPGPSPAPGAARRKRAAGQSAAAGEEAES